MSQIASIPAKVLIKGAGDLASGVAHRLWQAGFQVAMLELPRPLVVRRTVSFAAAVYAGEVWVEGVRAKLCQDLPEAGLTWQEGGIPILIDPDGISIPELSPYVLVDAIMAKANTGTSMKDASIVIGLGPGFVAGKDVHAVIETKRGHDLGRVLYQGGAIPNTGVPGMIGGYAAERLLRSPADGIFEPVKEIGDLVEKGEAIATVSALPVLAPISGLLRGLLFPGLPVAKGLKIGDIDPRGREVDATTLSDKSRSVAGGVLEAILRLHHLKTVNIP
jgi:xanthine dehydrogenase accessory factor